MSLRVLWVSLIVWKMSCCHENTTFMNMPLHVQSRACDYLPFKDYWRIQEWNMEMFQQHNQLNNIIEYEKRHKFYNLARFISIFPTKMTYEGFTHYLHHLRLNETIGPIYTIQDITFIEKIILKIAVSKMFWMNEKLIVNAFVDHLKLPSNAHNNTQYRPLLIMQQMMQGTVQFERLEQIFEFGLYEMQITGCKYNRYIRFAFHQMDKLSRGRLVSLNTANYFMVFQKIWSMMPTPVLVAELLLRRSRGKIGLFSYGSRHCFRIIMIAAINNDNGTFNEEILKFVLDYPHLFTVELVLRSMLMDHHDLQTIINLLQWMIKNRLADWNTIHGVLFRMRRLQHMIDPVVHGELCAYAMNQINPISLEDRQGYFINIFNGNTAKRNPLEGKYTVTPRAHSTVSDLNDDSRTRTCCTMQ